MATPPIDPQSILTGLFTAQQPQAQQPMPQQVGGDPLTQAMTGSMQAGQQAFQQDAARRQALAQQLAQLQQQQAALQPPQTGYEPQFKPATSAGNVAGNVGKGLLLGLSATAPGQAVSQAVYGPGERRYATQAGSLANQIAELQKQMGPETEAMQASAGMASKPMTAAARLEVGQMNNQTRQLHDQAWQRLQQSKQQLDRDVAAGKITQAQAHDRIEQQINAAHDATLRAVTSMTTDQRDRDTQIQAVEGEWRVNRENLLGGYLGSQMGIVPAAPSQTPAAAPGPKAAGSKPAKAPGKTAAPAQHTPGGTAGGLQEGATGTGSDGKKYVVRGGKWQAQ